MKKVLNLKIKGLFTLCCLVFGVELKAMDSNLSLKNITAKLAVASLKRDVSGIFAGLSDLDQYRLNFEDDNEWVGSRVVDFAAALPLQKVAESRLNNIYRSELKAPSFTKMKELVSAIRRVDGWEYLDESTLHLMIEKAKILKNSLELPDNDLYDLQYLINEADVQLRDEEGFHSVKTLRRRMNKASTEEDRLECLEIYGENPQKYAVLEKALMQMAKDVLKAVFQTKTSDEGETEDENSPIQTVITMLTNKFEQSPNTLKSLAELKHLMNEYVDLMPKKDFNILKQALMKKAKTGAQIEENPVRAEALRRFENTIAEPVHSDPVTAQLSLEKVLEQLRDFNAKLQTEMNIIRDTRGKGRAESLKRIQELVREVNIYEVQVKANRSADTSIVERVSSWARSIRVSIYSFFVRRETTKFLQSNRVRILEIMVETATTPDEVDTCIQKFMDEPKEYAGVSIQLEKQIAETVTNNPEARAAEFDKAVVEFVTSRIGNADNLTDLTRLTKLVIDKLGSLREVTELYSSLIARIENFTSLDDSYNATLLSSLQQRVEKAILEQATEEQHEEEHLASMELVKAKEAVASAKRAEEAASLKLTNANKLLTEANIKALEAKSSGNTRLIETTHQTEIIAYEAYKTARQEHDAAQAELEAKKAELRKAEEEDEGGNEGEDGGM